MKNPIVTAVRFHQAVQATGEPLMHLEVNKHKEALGGKGIQLYPQHGFLGFEWKGKNVLVPIVNISSMVYVEGDKK